MRKHLSRGVGSATKLAKARPQEVRWSLIGAVAGAAIGFAIGGVGIASMGGAVGIPAAVILAAIGGMLGNRYGISRDRPLR